MSFSELPSGWQAVFPAFTVSGNDGAGTNDSGIVSLKYKLVTERGEYPNAGLTDVTVSGGSVSNWNINGAGAVDGINYIYYVAEDGAGNMTQGYSSAIKLDTTVPGITVGASVSEGSAAMFDVEAAFGVSGGTITFTKQGGDIQWPVSGTAEGDGKGGYTFTATPGVSEEGTYVFTVTTGAGKTTQVAAPAICRVTLYAGEGSFDPMDDWENTSTWLVVSGGEVTPPTVENQQAPKRKGYTLKGWYTNTDLDQEYDSGQPVTGDISLYAGWDLNTVRDCVSVERRRRTMSGVSNQPPTHGGKREHYAAESRKKRAIFSWAGAVQVWKKIPKTVIIPKGSVGNREYTVNWAEVAVTMDGWTYGDAPNEPVLEQRQQSRRRRGNLYLLHRQRLYDKNDGG
ncbi:MAG: InlB B-repeat-containing protein [Clostridia bacterium]